jgi:hypothetical protein
VAPGHCAGKRTCVVPESAASLGDHRLAGLQNDSKAGTDGHISGRKSNLCYQDMVRPENCKIAATSIRRWGARRRVPIPVPALPPTLIFRQVLQHCSENLSHYWVRAWLRVHADCTYPPRCSWRSIGKPNNPAKINIYLASSYYIIYLMIDIYHDEFKFYHSTNDALRAR